MRIDYLVMQEVSLLVQAGDLAAIPEARIYGHGALLANRRGKQQLSEILSEYVYGLDVSLLLGLLDYLVAD
jgi:hypothetical protein